MAPAAATADSIMTLEETCIMCPRRGPNDAQNVWMRDCQRLDWKNHKILCASFSEARPSTAGVDVHAHRRALFFPDGDQPPRFTWLAVSKNPQTAGESFNKEAYFRRGGHDSASTNHNSIQARDIHREQYETLWFTSKRYAANQAPNVAVRSFTRAGACAQHFRGPILVTRWVASQHRAIDVRDVRTAPGEYRDIDMRDVRKAADYLSSAYRRGGQDPDLDSVRVPVGIVVCPRTFVRSPVGYFIVNGCDSIFQAEGSGLANLLGLPMTVRPWYAHPTGSEDLRNQTAMLLMRDITSVKVSTRTSTPGSGDGDFLRGMEGSYCGEQGFASTPQTWTGNKIGDVLVARADGLPLLSLHLEALCLYVSTKVEPRLAQAVSGLTGRAVVLSREQVLGTITKADFLAFFEELRAQRAPTDPRWRLFPTPYSMTREFIESPRATAEEMYNDQRTMGHLQTSDD
ncbi:hypothetical protein EDD36DRAFT_497871 [Exophiala viscosa]|uniref:MYND-type zinc finger protein samB n=1 Tax=Exophiala viscosa TaxID=2486360 RepID=A0AAN6ICX4_9EURO|nr:hypothetical protein EDD36DRAFT_497871 [Exophiala viscosa]